MFEGIALLCTVSAGMLARKYTGRAGASGNSFQRPTSFEGPFIIALDQGTSSTRAVLYDRHAKPLLSHQEQFQNIQRHKTAHGKDGKDSQADWAEQDPLVLLSTSQACLQGLVAQAAACKVALDLQNVHGLGVTNQRETTIVWDRLTGKPLYNAILWYDNRTSAIVEEIVNQVGSKDHFRDKTGLVLSTYFSALKLAWLLRNVPEVKKAVDDGRCLFGTVDSWLVWHLTGGPDGGKHLTDVTNASRTMLMDIESLDWDDSLLKVFDIPRSILPTIQASSGDYGALKDSSLAGVPILSCIGDQQAALVGHTCLKAGQAKCTYGTGAFMLYNTGPTIIHSTQGLLTTVAYQLGTKEGGKGKAIYALEGSISVCGLAYQWIRNNLKAVEDVSEIGQLVTSVSASNVYCVPAFTGLLAPYWDPNAKGILTGLTHQTGLAHIARAMVESIGFNVNDIMKAAVNDSHSLPDSIVVDGGASKLDFLLQFQSDIAQVPVLQALDVEATSRGAALAAGSYCGLYDLEKIASGQAYERTFRPQISAEEQLRLIEGWDKAVRLACDNKK